MEAGYVIFGVALVFGIQLLFCWKAKRAAVKCIPLYLLILGFLYGAGTYVGLFGTYSFGDISGAALAWLVYWIVGLAKRRKACLFQKERRGSWPRLIFACYACPP